MAVYNGTQKVKLSGISKIYNGTQLVYQKDQPQWHTIYSGTADLYVANNGTSSWTRNNPGTLVTAGTANLSSTKFRITFSTTYSNKMYFPNTTYGIW